MMLISLGTAIGVPLMAQAVLPPVKPPLPSWFTKKQLLHLFHQLDGQTTRETLDMVACRCWTDNVLLPHEHLHLAIMRMSNIMNCKTLDRNSDYWLVVSPEMCSKPTSVWHPFMFADYTTPGKMGGEYIRRDWRSDILEEVTPGVYKVGRLCGKWWFYVCEDFPDNKVMLGMGHREVIQYKSDGTMKQMDLGGKIYEYPNRIPYMGKPTKKNYAVITLDYGK